MANSRMLWFLMALGLGCGSRAPAAREPTPPPAVANPTESVQEAGCAALCDRVTDCAIEDAENNLTPEELAKLRPAELREKHSAACARSCEANALSRRQLEVIRDCVNAESSCDEFIACMDAASPTETAASTSRD